MRSVKLYERAADVTGGRNKHDLMMVTGNCSSHCWNMTEGRINLQLN